MAKTIIQYSDDIRRIVIIRSKLIIPICKYKCRPCQHQTIDNEVLVWWLVKESCRKDQQSVEPKKGGERKRQRRNECGGREGLI